MTSQEAEGKYDILDEQITKEFEQAMKVSDVAYWMGIPF